MPLVRLGLQQRFPVSNNKLVDQLLEERMELAQKISSMVLALRKKVNIRVRQPLNKLLIPVLNESFQKKVESVQELILAEVNVKQIEFIHSLVFLNALNLLI